MEISILQAVLIGLLAYLGSLSVPWLLGLSGGWYTITRPLVSGLLIGLVLGDVQTGIIVGVAVQVVYIALVTPGGQMPQDLNAAAYIGVSLGIASVRAGSTVEAAVAIATAVGAVGTIFHNFMMVTNSFWNHRAIAAIDQGDFKGLYANHYIYPQAIQFLYRFVPTAIIVYYGSSLAQTILATFPVDSFVMKTLTVLGGMLPAVGVAILLVQVVKKPIDIIYFLFGFAVLASLGTNMIGLAIVGAFFAYLNFRFTAPAAKPAATSSPGAPQLAAASDVNEEL